jgi:hypothetical protein
VKIWQARQAIVVTNDLRGKRTYHGKAVEVKGSMKNIEMHVEGDILTIVVDLKQEFGLSSSGKSITVASTEGNVSVPEREDIKIGLNIYRPRSKNER